MAKSTEQRKDDSPRDEPAKAKDRTAAARQARYRQRRREARAVALRDAVTPVTAPVTQARVTPSEAAIEARVTVMPPRRHAAWTAGVLIIIAALALLINAQTGAGFGAAQELRQGCLAPSVHRAPGNGNRQRRRFQQPDYPSRGGRRPTPLAAGERVPKRCSW
jgi:hypothetical protein